MRVSSKCVWVVVAFGFVAGCGESSPSAGTDPELNPPSTRGTIGYSSGYNTTLLQELGTPPLPMLAEAHQDLVVLIREQDGPTKLSVLQYGGESSLDP